MLEMLLAIGVFSIVAALAYGGLVHIVKHQTKLQKILARQLEVQTAIGLMTRELQQSLPRPSLLNLGSLEPAMVATNKPPKLVFTRQIEQMDNALISLHRVSYKLIDGQLWREQWPLIKATKGTQNYVLLDQVESLQWSFLDGQQIWHGQWPPSINGLTAMPAAVKIHLRPVGTLPLSVVIMGYGAAMK